MIDIKSLGFPENWENENFWLSQKVLKRNKITIFYNRIATIFSKIKKYANSKLIIISK
jgi:hypothetical protein